MTDPQIKVGALQQLPLGVEGICTFIYNLTSYMVWCGSYLFFTNWHLTWFGVEGIYSWEIYLLSDILYGLVWKVFILGRFIYNLTSYMVWCGSYSFLGGLFTNWHLTWFGVEGIYTWEIYHLTLWKVAIRGRFNLPRTQDHCSLRVATGGIGQIFNKFWYIIKCHFQGGATKQIAQFSGKLAKPYSS